MPEKQGLLKREWPARDSTRNWKNPLFFPNHPRLWKYLTGTVADLSAEVDANFSPFE
jgi:hypothetical protein